MQHHVTADHFIAGTAVFGMSILGAAMGVFFAVNGGYVAAAASAISVFLVLHGHVAGEQGSRSQ